MRVQNIYIIFVLTLMVSFIGAKSFAAPPSAVPSNIGVGGTINVHDMNMIKEKQRFKKRETDFEKLQKRKKQEETEPEKPETEHEVKSTKKTPVIKAQVEEFQTKGVYIDSVEVSKSEILTDEELKNITDKLVNKNIFMTDVKSVVDEINRLYQEKGFITARAYLPEQTINNGLLKIELIEGRVGRFDIKGNRWTRNSYIKGRISQNSGDLFDISKLEQDIVRFNRYNTGIQLNANLESGEAEGTTDIYLEARETSPFRFMTLWDNAGRKTIGKQRTGFMVSNDSLFGFRDKFSAGTYLSRSSVTPFADYNVPINKYDGRIGGLFSSGRSEITSGDYKMFNIESRSYNYSLYYSQPIIRKPMFELSSIASMNYKEATTSFDGFDLRTDKITSALVGVNARYDTKKGIWYLSQNASYAFPIIQSESDYFKYEGNLVRLHDFGHGIVGQFRLMYQYVPQDVIPYIDQFQSGGLSTTRGYTEGVLIGKTGYIASAEIIFPIAPKTVKIKGKQIPFIGSWVKGAFFVDQSGIFPFKGKGPGEEGITKNDFLASVGPGLRFQLPGELTARLYWGFPLITNSHEAINKMGRIHFEICMSPDFDLIVKNRKTRADKNKNSKEKEDL